MSRSFIEGYFPVYTLMRHSLGDGYLKGRSFGEDHFGRQSTSLAPSEMPP